MRGQPYTTDVVISSGRFSKVQMGSAPRLRLRVPGSTAGIRRAIDAFDAFRDEHAVAVAAPRQVQLALDELLSNIVKYAYANRDVGVIDLTYTVVGGECQVSIMDDGAPYDPLSAPAADTTSPLDQRQPGGLGIHLVRELMDRIEYARREGRNCLLLAVRLSA